MWWLGWVQESKNVKYWREVQRETIRILILITYLLLGKLLKKQSYYTRLCRYVHLLKQSHYRSYYWPYQVNPDVQTWCLYEMSSLITRYRTYGPVKVGNNGLVQLSARTDGFMYQVSDCRSVVVVVVRELVLVENERIEPCRKWTDVINMYESTLLNALYDCAVVYKQ